MTNKHITPEGSTVPPRPAGAPAHADGTTANEPNANGMTNGRGEPVSGVASENPNPPDAGVGAGTPVNTTGLGSNAVEGNSVGGRQPDQGVPAGVVNRLKAQKEDEQKGKNRP